MSSDTALYVHVPFCVRKCAYCDFYSEVAAMPEMQAQYAEALAKELRTLPEPFNPTTCYIGGGTPTALNASALSEVLEKVMARAPHAEEKTCEVNPGTLTEEKAEILRRSGINRVSLGAQSFNDRVLAFLGRIHRAGDIEAACRLLRDHGIDNISLDLIYGLPLSVSRGPADDLAQLLSLSPDHISCYALSYEAGTPLHRDMEAGRIRVLDDEGYREQYDMIRSRLKSAGFVQYEISNFALPGRECRHNITYWTGGYYHGVGPAAHSFWQGRRYGNARDFRIWRDRVEAMGWSPETEDDEPDARGRAREFAVMSLRMLRGLSRRTLMNTTGFSLKELYPTEVSELTRLGMLHDDGETIRLTDDALFISNAVFTELI